MEGIKFLNSPGSYNLNAAFVVHFSNINSKKELLEQLSNKLKFPDYFGFNWDALLDMLCDFHWIDQQKIVLVHDDLPVLDEVNLRTYLEILFESTKSWQEWKGEEHYLEVVFPEQVKDLIQQLWAAQ